MKRVYKSIISLLLITSMLLGVSVPALAAGGTEEYICDLRIVYADSYEEAEEILAESVFYEYILLDENLNEDTGEIGVWLAYKTTANIEDAITDIAVMQENGGYVEGSYQERLKESAKEYQALSEVYLRALSYFREAYDAGHFLAESAYRQLNFYYVKTVGIKSVPPFEGERLGDILLGGIGTGDLATIFMEGNTYALDNVRALIAMGVAYNEDGKTYLQRVSEEADLMAADPVEYASGFDDALAAIISDEILGFSKMFKELALYEGEMNYDDEDLTDAEITYIEYKALADMLREVPYLGGKTLYDFCRAYVEDEDDYSTLYPLVAALNEGQAAMTEVFHYHDVVRYSAPFYAEDVILEELLRLEEIYGENPFNIYEGVDRTVFEGTFAMTSAAYRTESYSSVGLYDLLFGEGDASSGSYGATFGVLGIAAYASAIFFRLGPVARHSAKVKSVMDAYTAKMTTAANKVATSMVSSTQTAEQFVDGLITQYLPGTKLTGMTFADKVTLMSNKSHLITAPPDPTLAYPEYVLNLDKIQLSVLKKQVAEAQAGIVKPVVATSKATLGMYAFAVVGSLLMLASALSLGRTIDSYYNPEFSDVPLSLVDVIDTRDGDRYIKYDAVYEAVPRERDSYTAADLNAYEGKHWNALYITRSYEAGKPLLADEFKLSYTSNKAPAGYMPVHRFGESVCYDLNKYTYNDDTSVYLSVKQSKNEKSAVAEVPPVVGSMLGTGAVFLVGGLGALLGVGGTLGVQTAVKRGRGKGNPLRA